MKTLSTRGWFGKASAGVILGFALALAMSGIFLRLPGGAGGKMQLAMWLMAPVWALVFSFVFLFRSPLAAWAWLGLFTAIAFALALV